MAMGKPVRFPLRVSPGVEQALRDASAKIDVMLAEISTGVRDHRHFDALEEQAQAIAVDLRKAFRGER